jgi:hypothetical protein
MKHCFYIALIIAVTSCTSKSKNKESTDPITDTIAPIDTVLTAKTFPPIDTLPVDSAVLKDLERAYIKGKPYWDYRPKANPPEGMSDMYCMVSEKLKFNADTIDDYLLTEYETRFAYSYIINGRTGRAIRFVQDSIIPIDLSTMFWHRPSDDGVIPKVVDVNCGDGLEELMIIYTVVGQGMIGNHLALYRYNEQTDAVNLIFRQTIQEQNYGMETDTIYSDSVNYIDVLYNIPECLNEITVQEGERTTSRSHTNYNRIKVKENAGSKTYFFNEKRNKFELKK